MVLSTSSTQKYLSHATLFYYKHHVVYSVGAQEGVVITLDGAQATFISPEKLVFSLKGGEM